MVEPKHIRRGYLYISNQLVDPTPLSKQNDEPWQRRKKCFLKVQKAREKSYQKWPVTVYERNSDAFFSFRTIIMEKEIGWVSDLDLACLKHQIAECCDHVHVCKRCTDTEEIHAHDNSREGYISRDQLWCHYLKKLLWCHYHKNFEQTPTCKNVAALASCSDRSQLERLLANTLCFCLDTDDTKTQWNNAPSRVN